MGWGVGSDVSLDVSVALGINIGLWALVQVLASSYLLRVCK